MLYLGGMKTTAKKRKRGNEAAFQQALKGLRPEYALAQEMIAARVRAGLSQAQLAERMGTRQTAIARLEAGRSSPSITTLRRLAQSTGSRLVVRLDERASG
jgi:ribosome-binding protein aMBF1 (putative translation factor)